MQVFLAQSMPSEQRNGATVCNIVSVDNHCGRRNGRNAPTRPLQGPVVGACHNIAARHRAAALSAYRPAQAVRGAGHAPQERFGRTDHHTLMLRRTGHRIQPTHATAQRRQGILRTHIGDTTRPPFDTPRILHLQRRPPRPDAHKPSLPQVPCRRRGAHHL